MRPGFVRVRDEIRERLLPELARRPLHEGS